MSRKEGIKKIIFMLQVYIILFGLQLFVQWSKVQEVGRNVKPKEQSFKKFDKPSAPFKPKPISVWRPKLKQTHPSSFPSDETQNTGISSPSVSATPTRSWRWVHSSCRPRRKADRSSPTSQRPTRTTRRAPRSRSRCGTT